MTVVTAEGSPWYRTLTAAQWRTLIATNLGWLFDGYETYALLLAVGPAMHSLLPPAERPHIPAFIGTVVAITLLGWGIGGLCGGILADYLGRKRTMIYAILAYAVLTGLTALSFNWISFALLRFLVGIAIGSEWATGSSMMAELWPKESRGKGASLMQCGFGIGFFIASLLWLFISAFGPQSWRYLFLVGILPALLVVWIRSSIDESQAWQQTDARRREARMRRQSGASLSAADRALARFTITDLFAEPEIRRRTILVFLLSFSTTIAWWGISSWVSRYIAGAAGQAHLPVQQWVSYAGMTYNLGGILGYIALGFLADSFGRKPTLMFYFVGAFLLTPVLYLWTHDIHLLLVAALFNGFFTLGIYSWMPVWLPELYPTRSRATGVAFAFNAPRLVAFLGPLFAGALIVEFHGFSRTAMIFACIYILGFVVTPFLPETKGQPLPA